MSQRRCYLCNIKQCDSESSFHSFPKDLRIREKWIKICNLNDFDNVKNLRICSNHFNEKDFTNYAMHGRAILKLKFGALPSRSTPNQTSSFPQISSSSINTTVTVDNTPCTSKQEIVPEIDNTRFLVSAELNVPITPSSLDRQSEVVATLEQPIKMEDSPQEETFSVQKNRKFHEPRYVGEITYSDLATPERAKRCLMLAETTIRKHKKKIKSLRNENRRLTGKINFLQDLLVDVCEKDLLSQELGDIASIT